MDDDKAFMDYMDHMAETRSAEPNPFADVINDICKITGASFDLVDSWSKTVDEDNLISMSAEELAEEFEESY